MSAQHSLSIRQAGVRQWIRPLAYAAVYLGWGTTYLAIRVGLQSLEPASFLALRYALAALALAPILVINRSWRGVKAVSYLHSSLQGLLLLVGGTLAMAYSEKTLASSVTAIIIGCAPVGFAVFDRLLNGAPIRRSVASGMLFGGLGVALLAGGSGSQAATAGGLALAIGGCVSWCFGSVAVKKLKPVPSPLLHVWTQYVAAALALSVFACVAEGFHPSALASATRPTLFALAYIAFVPSLLSYTAYMWLLRNEPSARVATYAFVNPIVAVLAGALVLGESASPRVLGALALVIAGTAATFKKPQLKTPPQRAGDALRMASTNLAGASASVDR